jgi:hypothetical protein
VASPLCLRDASTRFATAACTVWDELEFDLFETWRIHGGDALLLMYALIVADLAE